MPIKQNSFDKVQIRLTSSAESILASLEPYATWIEQMLGVPLSETLTLEVDCNPGDVVAEELLQGLPIVFATRARNSNWRTLIEGWELPHGVSPRIALSLQRERKPNAAPLPVWELDWQDCPVAFKVLRRRVPDYRQVAGREDQRDFNADYPMCQTSHLGSLFTGRMRPKFCCWSNRCRTTPNVISKPYPAAFG